MDNKNNKKFNLDINSLMEEYKFLQNELLNVEKFYNEVKQEKEDNKGTARNNYVFIASQNATLNSLHTQRVGIISKMSDIKKTIADFQMKAFNINKNIDSENSANGNTDLLVRELLTMISDKKLDQTEIVQPIEEDNDEEFSLSALDKVLEEKFSDDKEDDLDKNKLDDNKLSEVIDSLKENDMEIILINDSEIAVFDLVKEDKVPFNKLDRDQVKLIDSITIDSINEDEGIASTNYEFLKLKVFYDEETMEEVV